MRIAVVSSLVFFWFFGFFLGRGRGCHNQNSAFNFVFNWTFRLRLRKFLFGIANIFNYKNVSFMWSNDKLYLLINLLTAVVVKYSSDVQQCLKTKYSTTNRRTRIVIAGDSRLRYPYRTLFTLLTDRPLPADWYHRNWNVTDEHSKLNYVIIKTVF